MKLAPTIWTLLFLPGCFPASAQRDRHCVVDAEHQTRIEMGALAEELSTYDVVFLGEQHESGLGHEMQLEITRRLARLREAVVISLEMFDRDVQGSVDDYLDGRISEVE